MEPDQIKYEKEKEMIKDSVKPKSIKPVSEEPPMAILNVAKSTFECIMKPSFNISEIVSALTNFLILT